MAAMVSHIENEIRTSKHFDDIHAIGQVTCRVVVDVTILQYLVKDGVVAVAASKLVRSTWCTAISHPSEPLNTAHESEKKKK
jgi:hypothetical protein